MIVQFVIYLGMIKYYQKACALGIRHRSIAALKSNIGLFSTGKEPGQEQQQKKGSKDPSKNKKFLFQFNHPVYKKVLKRFRVNFFNLLDVERIDKAFNLKEKIRRAQETGKDGPNTEQKDTRNSHTMLRWSAIIGLLAFILLSGSSGGPGQGLPFERPPVNFAALQQQIKQLNNQLSRSHVTIIYLYKENRYRVIVTTPSLKNFMETVNQEQLVKILQILETFHDKVNVEFKTNFNNVFIRGEGMVAFIFGGLLWSLIAYVGYMMFKGFRKASNSMSGGLNEIMGGKSFKPVEPEKNSIFFKDVAGMHEAKFEITEFVDFLKKPDKYIEMGAKVPKGALLTGPPGTGKTLLAKACAGEAGVPFFSVSGSDFVEKYVGLGASRVRSLFDEAQKNAPSIIFIDQIDAIGKKRDNGPFSNEERNNTLNQLLVRMDGFETKNKVIVMAATNRKDMLDPALLRPGRFDRSVEIGLPNLEQRAQILKVHLKKVKYDSSIPEDELAKKIARLTPGFSGAQLMNTCNQAAILAARQKLQSIPLSKFQKATERVMAGLQKRNMFTEQQKQILAFYQAGKAVANWFTQGADPIIKISILPFSKSKSGYSHSIKDETALHTKQQLLTKVCLYLAGRCAEQHFKGYVSTNGNNDLERAKRIVSMIVKKFGMSDSLKMMAFPDFDFTRKPYSDKIEAMIDNEIFKITSECQRKAQQLIKSKQNEIKLLQSKILQKQTLTHSDIKQILGDRPFAANEVYQQYLKDQEAETIKMSNEPRAGVASG